MIMRRVGRVNSCHRPLPGYALALTMSVRPPGCRRGCGWAGGPGAKPADLPVGTGLGLVISRRFCQMMGGDITTPSGEASTKPAMSRATTPEGHNERLADIARFEDYVTRQGTKILKLDRREIPTPPRCIHRKACGNCSNSGVPPGRWRRAEAPTSSRHCAFRSVADVDPIIAGPNDAGVVGVAPVVVAPASRRDGKASASKVGDANASAGHGTAEAGKPSSTETATKRGTTEATT
jgi:hypothetical protein